MRFILIVCLSETREASGECHHVDRAPNPRGSNFVRHDGGNNTAALPAVRLFREDTPGDTISSGVVGLYQSRRAACLRRECGGVIGVQETDHPRRLQEEAPMLLLQSQQLSDYPNSLFPGETQTIIARSSDGGERAHQDPIGKAVVFPGRADLTDLLIVQGVEGGMDEGQEVSISADSVEILQDSCVQPVTSPYPIVCLGACPIDRHNVRGSPESSQRRRARGNEPTKRDDASNAFQERWPHVWFPANDIGEDVAILPFSLKELDDLFIAQLRDSRLGSPVTRASDRASISDVEAEDIRRVVS